MKTIAELKDQFQERRSIVRPEPAKDYRTRAERRSMAHMVDPSRLVVDSWWYVRTTQGWTFVRITDILRTAQGITYEIRGRTNAGPPFRPRMASDFREHPPRPKKRRPPSERLPNDVVIRPGDLLATSVSGLSNCPVIVQGELEPEVYEVITVHTESILERPRHQLRVYRESE